MVELHAGSFTWLGAGTRHSAALHAALTIQNGAVLVRSDAGAIHVLTAESARRGVAYKVPQHLVEPSWEALPFLGSTWGLSDALEY